jgi:hypothetical protein
MSACIRCKQPIVEQIYHTKNRKGRAYPVGTPGKHVRRLICACGCYSVDVFRVIDYDRVRTRDTSAEHFDLKSLIPVQFGGVRGYA